MFQNKEVKFEWMEIFALFGVSVIITAIISLFIMM